MSDDRAVQIGHRGRTAHTVFYHVLQLAVHQYGTVNHVYLEHTLVGTQIQTHVLVSVVDQVAIDSNQCAVARTLIVQIGIAHFGAVCQQAQAMLQQSTLCQRLKCAADRVVGIQRTAVGIDVCRLVAALTLFDKSAITAEQILQALVGQHFATVVDKAVSGVYLQQSLATCQVVNQEVFHFICQHIGQNFHTGGAQHALGILIVFGFAHSLIDHVAAHVKHIVQYGAEATQIGHPRVCILAIGIANAVQLVHRLVGGILHTQSKVEHFGGDIADHAHRATVEGDGCTHGRIDRQVFQQGAILHGDVTAEVDAAQRIGQHTVVIRQYGSVQRGDTVGQNQVDHTVHTVERTGSNRYCRVGCKGSVKHVVDVQQTMVAVVDTATCGIVLGYCVVVGNLHLRQVGTTHEHRRNVVLGIQQILRVAQYGIVGQGEADGSQHRSVAECITADLCHLAQAYQAQAATTLKGALAHRQTGLRFRHTDRYNLDALNHVVAGKCVVLNLTHGQSADIGRNHQMLVVANRTAGMTLHARDDHVGAHVDFIQSHLVGQALNPLFCKRQFLDIRRHHGVLQTQVAGQLGVAGVALHKAAVDTDTVHDTNAQRRRARDTQLHQSSTTGECVVANFQYALGNHQAHQVATIGECVFADSLQAVRQIDIGQRRTTLKGVLANGLDVGAQNHGLYVGSTVECQVTHAHHVLAVDLVGDTHRAAVSLGHVLGVVTYDLHAAGDVLYCKVLAFGDGSQGSARECGTGRRILEHTVVGGIEAYARALLVKGACLDQALVAHIQQIYAGQTNHTREGACLDDKACNLGADGQRSEFLTGKRTVINTHHGHTANRGRNGHVLVRGVAVVVEHTLNPIAFLATHDFQSQREATPIGTNVEADTVVVAVLLQRSSHNAVDLQVILVTAVEQLGTQGGNDTLHVECRQVATLGKRTRANTGHTRRHRHRHQLVVTGKCQIQNLRDGSAVDGIGNDQFGIGTVVALDTYFVTVDIFVAEGTCRADLTVGHRGHLAGYDVVLHCPQQ